MMQTNSTWFKWVAIVLMVTFLNSSCTFLPDIFGAKNFTGEISPPDLAQDVFLETPIVFAFEKGISEDTDLNRVLQVVNTRTGKLVEGKAALSGRSKVLTFTPDQNWEKNTHYLVNLGPLWTGNNVPFDTDPKQVGNQGLIASFKTIAGDTKGPQIENITPAEFGTLISGTPIVIKFNEPLKARSVDPNNIRLFNERGDYLAPTSLAIDADNMTVRYNPRNSDIKDGVRYTLTVVPDILDKAGNSMTVVTTRHFIGKSSTAPQPPSIPPPRPNGNPQPVKLGNPVVLKGKGKPGHFVKALWDYFDIFPRGTLVSAGGDWEMTLAPMPLGVTEIRLAQFDRFGNTSTLSEPVNVVAVPPKREDNTIYLTAGAAHNPLSQKQIEIKAELPGQKVSFATEGGKGVELPAKIWVHLNGQRQSFDFNNETIGPFDIDSSASLTVSITPSDKVESASITSMIDGQVIGTQTIAMEEPFLSVTQPRHLPDGEPTLMVANVRGLGYDAQGEIMGIPLQGHQIGVKPKPLNPADLPFLGIAVDPPAGGPSPDDPTAPLPPAYRPLSCGERFSQPEFPNVPQPPPGGGGPQGQSRLLGHLPFIVIPKPGAPGGAHPQFRIAITDFSVYLSDGSHPVFETEVKNHPFPAEPETELTTTPNLIGENRVAIAEPTQNPTIGTTRVRTKPKDPEPVVVEEPEEKPEPQEQELCGDPIMLHSGEFQHRKIDLRIPSRGFDFKFTRTYKSRIHYNGVLGVNWEFNYNSRVRRTPDKPNSISWYTGFGKALEYLETAPGSKRYRSPNGHYDALTMDTSGTIQIRQSNGRKLVFHSLTSGPAAGKITRLEDRAGNAMVFKYDNRGRLEKILDTMSREYSLSYNSLNRIEKLTDFSGREVLYRYDMWGNLTDVRSPIVVGTSTGNNFPEGRTTRYTYSRGFPDQRLNHNLLTITDPREVQEGGPPWLINCYDTDPDSYSYDRVITQRAGGVNRSRVEAGGSWLYKYYPINKNSSGMNLPKTVTVVTDRNGNIDEFRFNQQGNMVQEISYANRNIRSKGTRKSEDPAAFITTHLYSLDGEKIVTVNPLGDRIESDYGSEDLNRNGRLDQGFDANNDGDFLDPQDRYPEDGNGNGRLDQSPRFSQGNLLQRRRIADGNRGGGPALVETFSYEPVYNQLLTVTDERENARSFSPQNGGTSNPGRFTTRDIFDYQEDSAGVVIPKLADEMNVSATEMTDMLAQSGISLGLGDINGDGKADGFAGHVIKREFPTITLEPGQTVSIAANGGRHQEVFALFGYNQFGDLSYYIDPEKNRTDYIYYPEADPDGDGLEVNPLPQTNSGRPFDPTTGGYLKSTSVDTKREAGRNSGANGQPLKLSTVYQYDPMGNILALIDGRGILHQYEVNSLNEIVRSTLAADTTSFVTGREMGRISPLGYEKEFRYDYNGNLIQYKIENVGEVDGNGQTSAQNPFWTTQYMYDILDDIVWETKEVQTIADDRRIDSTLANTITTYFRYDANQNIIAEIRPEGNQINWIYDERDYIYSVTRATGSSVAARSFTYYDDNGNIDIVTDAVDNGSVDPEFNRDITEIEYDGFNRVSRITDGVGNQRKFQYDPASQIVREATFDPISQGGRRLSEVAYFYDELGRNFRIDRRIFDAAGGQMGSNIPTIDDPILPGNPNSGSDGEAVYLFEFDKNNRVVRSVEPDGDDILLSFDGANRKITHKSPPVSPGSPTRRNVTQWKYDANSNAIQIQVTEEATDPGQPAETFITDYLYDAVNRPIRSTDNLGQTVRAGYDSRGNLVVLTDPRGPKVRDPLDLFPGNRQVNESQINDHGNITRLSYDGLNRLLQRKRFLRADGMGSGLLDEHAGLGLDKSGENPDGIILELNNWDKNSRLSSEIDDNGNVTTFVYDALDRLMVNRGADDTRSFSFFDKDFNVTRYLDKNGTAISQTYDDIHRPLKLEVVRASQVKGTTLQTYQWDGRSRLINAVDNNDPAKPDDDVFFFRKFDSLDRLLSESQTINGKTYATNSDYNADNTRRQFQYAAGNLLSITYDKLNRPIQREDGDFSALTNNDIVKTQYIGPNRVTDHILANGVTATLAYDGVRRVKRIQYVRSQGNQLITGFNYGYDRADNRSFQQALHTGSQLGENYLFDSVNRLIQHNKGIQPAQLGNPQAASTSTLGYKLDGVDNRITVTSNTGTISYNHSNNKYRPDNQNEYNQIIEPNGAVQARVHDNNGNLVDDGKFVYHYDFINRLVGIGLKATGTSVAQYTFDASMRRVTKRTALDSIKYIWDGWRIVEERDPNNDLVSQYVYGNYLDEVLRVRKKDVNDLNANGNTTEILNFYPQQDAVFSLAALANQAGNPVESLKFSSAYGELSENPKISAVGFQGLHQDPETGFNFVRLRNYDPGTGRFIQRDIAGTVGWMNLYQFGNSNPTIYGDPNGDWAWVIAGAVIGAVVGGVSAALSGGSAGEIALAATAGAVVGVVAGATFGIGAASTGMAKAGAYVLGTGALGHSAAMGTALGQGRPLDALGHMDAGMVLGPGGSTPRLKPDPTGQYQHGQRLLPKHHREFHSQAPAPKPKPEPPKKPTVAPDPNPGSSGGTQHSVLRPGTRQGMGGNGKVLRDGEGATPAEIAASSGGPGGGSRAGQSRARQDLLDAIPAGEPIPCWRCGHTTTNPANVHLGHRNVATSQGGNLEPANIALEGAACNLSAGNRGGVKEGRSCAERGGCGTPYGRTD